MDEYPLKCPANTTGARTPAPAFGPEHAVLEALKKSLLHQAFTGEL